MKRLNSKGMTTVEILVCFVIVILLTTSMYATVSSYKNKQQIESYKQSVIAYKNLLTKEIQDDLIKKRVIAVDTSESTNGSNKYERTTKLTFTFADHSKKDLIIYRKMARDYDYNSSDDASWACQDDSFYIKYGDDRYNLPSLGFGKSDQNGCPNNKIQDLRIHNVSSTVEGGVLKLVIDFYHVDLPNKYGINIICPVNF